MKYGYFDDASREYVITTPQTPRPWINYLGCEDFFGLISNHGEGYSFFRDARLRRITRYRYNSVGGSGGGRFFYINDGGDIWSPGWLPVKSEPDSYEVRHGMGYTKISGTRRGITCSVLHFVPLGQSVEVHQVSLCNNSPSAKTFNLFSYAEFCLYNALDDMTNFQRNLNTGEVHVEGSTIFHLTEFRERRNHYTWYHGPGETAGFETSRDAFLGPYNGYDSPRTVYQNRASNTLAHGWSPIASHFVPVTLDPGESKEFNFVLGYSECDPLTKFHPDGSPNLDIARATISQLASAKALATARENLREHWDRLLANYSVSSGNKRLDRMVNIWNQYQCMVTFNMSRSASFFESGVGRGMGFRDSNQDLLGFVHQIPDRARQRILDIASTQFEDGGCYHQYQPLTKKGNHEVGGNFNDDPLWLILGVVAYIKETGDMPILNEQVPWNCNPHHTGTLFEHCAASFNHVVNNLGPHGLPLIGRADWNDCLNLNCFSSNPDESFQTCTSRDGKTAESVMIAGLFLAAGAEYLALCRRSGADTSPAPVEAAIKAMRAAIDNHGWDGNWFLRAYDDTGRPVGSSQNEEAQIFIESQGWCVIGGVGFDNGRALQALDSVELRLATPHGIVLNNPPFTRYHVELGEISTYPAGYKENAGVFCHNNPWIVIAETMLGRGEKAFDYWKRIAPAFREDISELNGQEPYVYAQMIAGKDAPLPGEAKNSWLTGASAWNFVAISQFILGIRPDYDSLIIDPCIPADWNGFTVQRRFRGANYTITVDNSSHVSKGIRSLTVDGTEVTGNRIPVKAQGKHVTVEVLMG